MIKTSFSPFRAVPLAIRPRRLPMLLLACFFGYPVLATSASNETVLNVTRSLVARGAFAEAAERGMADLLVQPWNHKLRLLVAESLRRLGRFDEAAEQLDVLDGTAYAKAAMAMRADLRPSNVVANLKLTTSLGFTPPVDTAEKSPKQQKWMVLDGSDGVAAEKRLDQAKQSPVNLADTGPQVQQDELPEAIAHARSAAAQHIVELNAAENYAGVAAEGVPLLAREKLDDEVRLIIANSLSWTNHLTEATPVYEGLLQGAYAKEARIGLGNIRHWSGRDDQAVILFRQVLVSDPANADALSGIASTRRELAPRTTVTVGGFNDSTGVHRRLLTTEHRWRDASAANIYAVEVGAVDDTLAAAETRQQAVTLRYQGLNLPLRPSLELSAPSNSGAQLFAHAVLHIGSNDQNLIDIGRVNWGNTALNPNALAEHLSATHIGAQATTTLPFGTVVGRVDHFSISDGNQIVSGGVRLASTWRPLGKDLKPFIGVETRHASFNTPNYWSPAAGYGSIYAGLERDWESADWNLSVSAQVGQRLYGEAGTSKALFASGKRWLSADFAAGFNASTQSSFRDGSAYRAQSLNLTLEKLW